MTFFLAEVKLFEEYGFNYKVDDLIKLENHDFFMISHTWLGRGLVDNNDNVKKREILDFARDIELCYFWIDAICLPKVKDKRTRAQFNFGLKRSTLFYATKNVLYLSNDNSRLWIWYELRQQNLHKKIPINHLFWYTNLDIVRSFNEENMYVNSDSSDVIKIASTLVVNPKTLLTYVLSSTFMLSIILSFLISQSNQSCFSLGGLKSNLSNSESWILTTVLFVVVFTIVWGTISKPLRYNDNSRLSIWCYKILFPIIDYWRNRTCDELDLYGDVKMNLVTPFLVVCCYLLIILGWAIYIAVGYVDRCSWDGGSYINIIAIILYPMFSIYLYRMLKKFGVAGQI